MATRDELFARAIGLYAQSKFEEAALVYRSVLDVDPRHADSLHGLAMSCFQLQRYDEAIETAKKILEIAPDDAFAHTSLSMFYQRKGMIAEAEKEQAQARVAGWRKEIGEEGGAGQAGGRPGS
jgi:Flp pilus assembly protein TadD